MILELSTRLYRAMSLDPSGQTTRPSARILSKRQRLCRLLVRPSPTTRRPTQYTVGDPLDRWPSGMGFDYYYAFMGGEDRPGGRRICSRITPRSSRGWAKTSYDLTTDMADEAIKLHEGA